MESTNWKAIMDEYVDSQTSWITKCEIKVRRKWVYYNFFVDSIYTIYKILFIFLLQFLKKWKKISDVMN